MLTVAYFQKCCFLMHNWDIGYFFSCGGEKDFSEKQIDKCVQNDSSSRFLEKM